MGYLENVLISYKNVQLSKQGNFIPASKKILSHLMQAPV